MTDDQFIAFVKKERKKIELLILAGLFVMQAGSMEIHFNQGGEIKKIQTHVITLSV